MWRGKWLHTPTPAARTAAAAAAAAAATDVSFDALVVSVRVPNERRVRYEVAVRERLHLDGAHLEPNAVVEVSQWANNGAAAVLAAATPGDLVRVEGFTVVPNQTRPGAIYYNCRGVRVLRRAAELAADDGFLGAQPALATGAVVLIPSRIVHCVADPSNPQPGMMSRVNWPPNAVKRSGDEPALSFSVQMVQWQAQQVADEEEEPQPQHYEATVWAPPCFAFVGGHPPPVDTWKALFPANHVPFVMLCSPLPPKEQQPLVVKQLVQPKLKVHCISVQLRTYLEQQCPCVSAELVRAHVGTTADAPLLDDAGVLNVSALGVPDDADERWLFYAMTSDPVALRTEAALQQALEDGTVEAVLWFATPQETQTKKKKTKRA